MDRSKHVKVSTGIIAIVGFVSFILTLAGYGGQVRMYYNSNLPNWEAAVDDNLFWEHAAQREQSLSTVRTTVSGAYPNSWADYDFAWDVYTLHVDQEPEAEALVAARDRLNGFDKSRTYDGTHYVELGFAAQGSLNEGQLVPAPEFVAQVQALHTSGLDSVLTELPPKPEAPVWFAKTAWNWLAVFPRWLVLWVTLSWVFYVIHAATMRSMLGSLYDEIVSEPGEPISRAILFAQTFWAIAFFAGLGALARTARASARGINIASDRLREMRHPNRAEIRRARRALKILKADGAAAELIARAEDILRQWSVIQADEAPARREKLSRRDRRLAAAASEVTSLHQELEADREATAAVRPPRERAKQ